jgi:hypothetical protein
LLPARFKSQLLDCPAHSLVTLTNELFWLLFEWCYVLENQFNNVTFDCFQMPELNRMVEEELLNSKISALVVLLLQNGGIFIGVSTLYLVTKYPVTIS